MNNSGNDSPTPPILTETMARLLLDQRHWREAIDIYRKLGQQNPKKTKVYEKQIAHLKNLLKIVEQQQPDIRKQRSS